MTIEAATDNRNTSILDNTVCINVTLSKLGISKKVKATEVEVDADKKMLRVSKKILDSKELKAIVTIDGKIRKVLSTYALPHTKLFRGGIYCLPAQYANTVDEELEALKTERETACEVFFDAYDAQAKEARAQLRALYDPLDYPTLDRVKRAFGMETQYVNMGLPTNLAGISQSIFERERDKQSTKISQAADEIRDAMRAMLKSLVDHMLERLTPDPDNIDDKTGLPKVKSFQKTLVSNMTTFLSTFDAKNIANDAELAELVAKSRAILKGVDPKVLRNNEDTRDYVLREMGSVKGVLDTMVVDANVRLYRDSDEEEENENTGDAQLSLTGSDVADAA